MCVLVMCGVIKMINDEVIEQLLAIKKSGCLTSKDRQAIAIAIKALRICSYLQKSGITVCTQDKELLNVIEWAERIVE